jgi:t-SNARE complex subunit (syntaxin)
MDIKNKVITRQVQIVEPDATDEEVDAVMKSEGGRYQLYKDRILASGVNDNDQIKTTYPKLLFLHAGTLLAPFTL